MIGTEIIDDKPRVIVISDEIFPAFSISNLELQHSGVKLVVLELMFWN